MKRGNRSHLMENKNGERFWANGNIKQRTYYRANGSKISEWFYYAHPAGHLKLLIYYGVNNEESRREEYHKDGTRKKLPIKPFPSKKANKVLSKKEEKEKEERCNKLAKERYLNDTSFTKEFIKLELKRSEILSKF